MTATRLLSYFAAPFPSARGFSPYRFPGLIVHLPVFGMFLLIGARLTLWDPAMYPLLLVYLAAGLYLGRDLAILAHYNPLITLGVVGGTGAAVAYPQAFVMLRQHDNALLSMAVTVTVAALFVAWVRSRIADEPALAVDAEACSASPTDSSVATSAKPRLFASAVTPLLLVAWVALVFLATYRPEHPRLHGFAWAGWLLPFVAAAMLALVFRGNAAVLRGGGYWRAMLLGLKAAALLIGLGLPTAVFVAEHADFRLHARMAAMIESTGPLRADILAHSLAPTGPALAGVGAVWPTSIRADAGMVGSDGTILLYDATLRGLVVLLPRVGPEGLLWRCTGFPRRLAPGPCRDYPPTSLENGAESTIAETAAALAAHAARLQNPPRDKDAGPTRHAAGQLPRTGPLDFGYVDIDGRLALYNDRYGLLLLVDASGAGHRCRLFGAREAPAACPSPSAGS